MRTFCLSLSLLFLGCTPSAPGIRPDAHDEPDAGDARDAGPFTDAGEVLDAGLVADAGASVDGGSGCAGPARFTCSADGNSRLKCVSGALLNEPCARGCLRSAPGTDDVCMGTTDTFSCTASYGTQRAQNGDYYLTAFGCWVDANGVAHGDPGDNCIPSCLAKAKAAGLCNAADTGKQCEERVTWFAADGARFGCLQRLRVENPKNGKKVVVVALDFGPACFVENSVGKAVLDASGRADRYLFGSDQGAVDKALVHVVEVDATTPLGPVP